MDVKTCTECNETKPLTDFYFIKARGRHMNYCSECNMKKMKVYRQNSEEYQSYHKEYQKTEKYKKMSKDCRSTDKSRKMHRERERERRKKNKLDVLGHYSENTMACARCGFSDLRALSIDHVNNDGHKHRKEIGKIGGHVFYTWLKNNDYPKDFQVLCMNCQFIKKAEQVELKKMS